VRARDVRHWIKYRIAREVILQLAVRDRSEPFGGFYGASEIDACAAAGSVLFHRKAITVPSRHAVAPNLTPHTWWNFARFFNEKSRFRGPVNHDA
jgi:hypothetical protein